MDGRHRWLTGQDKAGDLGLTANALGEHLVDTMPDRMAPPNASRAPESKLPVCELWMFPFKACSLYRPRMTSSFSFWFSRGCKPCPAPLPGHPWPTTLCYGTRCRKRSRQIAAGLAGRFGSPGLTAPCGERFHPGSAMDIPRPRSIVRRVAPVKTGGLCLTSWQNSSDRSWVGLFLVEQRRESSMMAKLRTIDHCLDGGLNTVVVSGQASLNFHQQRFIGKFDRSSQRIAE